MKVYQLRAHISNTSHTHTYTLTYIIYTQTYLESERHSCDKSIIMTLKHTYIHIHTYTYITDPKLEGARHSRDKSIIMKTETYIHTYTCIHT